MGVPGLWEVCISYQIFALFSTYFMRLLGFESSGHIYLPGSSRRRQWVREQYIGHV